MHVENLGFSDSVTYIRALRFCHGGKHLWHQVEKLANYDDYNCKEDTYSRHFCHCVESIWIINANFDKNSWDIAFPLMGSLLTWVWVLSVCEGVIWVWRLRICLGFKCLVLDLVNIRWVMGGLRNDYWGWDNISGEIQNYELCK